MENNNNLSIDSLLPDNLNEFGWGPDLEEIPKKFAEIPYTPFTKDDTFGKICDWYHKKKIYNPQRIQTIKNIFFYKAQRDDKYKQTQKVVTQVKPKKHTRNNEQKGRLKMQERTQQEEEDRKSNRRWNKHNKAFITKAQKNKWNSMNTQKRTPQIEVRESSFSIQSNWEKIEIFEFVALNKESSSTQSPPETLKTVGKLYPIQKNMEKINTKTKTILDKKYDKIYSKITTKDDPIIRDFAEKNVANVFAIDSIISLLMSCTRTVYSWDIAVKKENGKLFFDKREGNSSFDYLHVNETAPEVPNAKDVENINGKAKLMEEATLIDRLFNLQSILPVPLPTQLDDYPFLNPSNNTSPSAYYYKVWNLGDDIKILIRSEATAENVGEETEIVTVHTLNEYDPKLTQWGQKLDGQRGGVFAKELLNNSSKISRWVAESYLAESSKMFLGFVGRTKERDNQNHTILGTQYYKTVDLFRQLGMKISQMWGVIRVLVEACMEQEDGDYIIIKEPNENRLVLYRIGEQKN